MKLRFLQDNQTERQYHRSNSTTGTILNRIACICIVMYTAIKNGDVTYAPCCMIPEQQIGPRYTKPIRVGLICANFAACYFLVLIKIKLAGGCWFSYTTLQGNQLSFVCYASTYRPNRFTKMYHELHSSLCVTCMSILSSCSLYMYK